MKGLTERQNEVLEFIRDFLETHQFPPTIREISVHFSISVKGAYDHVKALEKKGFIRCTMNHSRTIEVLRAEEPRREKNISIPILGRVAAGRPLLAEENLDGHVKLPENFLKYGTYFALQVQGDSMIDAGIMDGDLAVIAEQPTASNGEIVVAMVDEAVTLKRFFREKNRIQLRPENPAYHPIYTTNVRILGKLAHILRSYE